MEHGPASARTALPAAQPADMDAGDRRSTKRKDPPPSVNKVSQRATTQPSGTPEHHDIAYSNLCPAWACTSQSLAHHATLTGRCLKSGDVWPSPSEGPSSHSTPFSSAARQRTRSISCQTNRVGHCHAYLSIISEPARSAGPRTNSGTHTQPESDPPTPAGVMHIKPKAKRLLSPLYSKHTQIVPHTSTAPCARHYPPYILTHSTSARAILYAKVFDPTLGYPGEGPLIVATYNINGTRGSLASVLAQAKAAKIDILLLQELHFYQTGEHNNIGKIAERHGWALVHSPASI